MNSLLCPIQKKTEGKKRTSPKTPKEKKRRVKKDRRGFSKKPSFACACARVGAAEGGVRGAPALPVGGWLAVGTGTPMFIASRDGAATVASRADAHP